MGLTLGPLVLQGTALATLGTLEKCHFGHCGGRVVSSSAS